MAAIATRAASEGITAATGAAADGNGWGPGVYIGDDDYYYGDDYYDYCYWWHGRRFCRY